MKLRNALCSLPLCSGVLFFAPPAMSQEGAFCAVAGGRTSYENCGYYTFEQCMMAVRGAGGHCRANPRVRVGPAYGKPDEPPPPPRRRR